VYIRDSVLRLASNGMQYQRCPKSTVKKLRITVRTVGICPQPKVVVIMPGDGFMRRVVHPPIHSF